jgi:hypothetical protein
MQQRGRNPGGYTKTNQLNLPPPRLFRQCQYGLYVPLLGSLLPTRLELRGEILLVYGLKDDAFPLWFSRRGNGHQHGTNALASYAMFGLPNRLIENILKSLLRQSGTLEVSKVNRFLSQGGVPNGINLLCHLYALGIRYRSLSLLTKFLDRLPVFAEIEFCADQDNRDIRSMMRNLREPLTWSAWNSRFPGGSGPLS